MENKTEDEICKRWEEEAKEKAERDKETQQRPKKRVRAIEYSQSSAVLGQGELDDILAIAAGSTASTARGRGGPTKKPVRAASSRARSRISEAVDGDETVVELD